MSDIENTYRISGEESKVLRDYLLFRRHLFAYEEVCRALPEGAVVADVGCGYGYALELLLEKASEVLAIDAADTALDSLPNLPAVRKIKAYGDAIPLPADSVDCAVAFQLLEHVSEDVAGAVLRELVRIAKPGSKVYATTPNGRWRLLPGQRPWNPYHVKEYRPEDMAALCRDALRDQPCHWNLRSVVGLHGAQDIELARVAPNRARRYGRTPLGIAQKMWQRLGPQRMRHWEREGARRVEERDWNSDWFTLAADASIGLDFWIEIEKTPT